MTIRHLLVAGAAIASLAVAAVSRAGDITYPGLNAATTVQDTDLLATWRASGPLTKVQASVLEAYIQGKLGGSFLQQSNNLSDLASITAARTNLGLGSAALASTGTTGTALCQLNSNCTWTGTEAFNAAVTFGLTTVHTGLATFNGGLTVASGAATLNGTNNVAGAAGTNRGFYFQTGTTDRWLIYANGTAESGGNAGSDLSVCRYADSNAGAPIDCPLVFSRSNGGLNLSYSLNAGGNISAAGLQATANGLNVTGGFTLNSGPLTLPAGSVANADLDTVNGSSGSCGSATTTCTFTTNAQGRITGQGSATIQPDTCVINNTSGYCKNPNGYAHQWYHFDSGSFNGWAGGPTTVTFPLSPSHGCFAYSAVTDNQGSQGSPYYALQIVSGPGGNSVTVSAAGFQSGSHSPIQGFYVTADCY